MLLSDVQVSIHWNYHTYGAGHFEKKLISGRAAIEKDRREGFFHLAQRLRDMIAVYK